MSPWGSLEGLEALEEPFTVHECPQQLPVPTGCVGLKILSVLVSLLAGQTCLQAS